MKEYIPNNKPEDVVKRAIYLAWKSSDVIGRGVLQDRGEQTEDAVWDNARIKGDYPGAEDRKPQDGHVYADYVFGRMMKIILGWDDKAITYMEDKPRPDYQMWALTYKSYLELLEAADEELT